jgi:hypothetical protein
VDAARRTQITPRLARTWLVILPIGKAGARDSDAGVALAAGRDTDVGTAAAHGHTYAGQRKVEMHTRQQFCAALKTEAHSLLMSAQTPELRNRGHPKSRFCRIGSGRFVF